MNERFTYRTNPHTDAELRQYRDASFLCRYGALRSGEARQYGEPGQDYLTFAADGQAFWFVMCDGVGLSFRGELAAQLLGDSLLNWGAELELARAGSEAELAASLTERLQQLSERACREVGQSPIPEDAPPMLREVLEEKRSSGSEAMFVCGKVECHPGGRDSNVLLAWMGDLRVKGWDSEGRPLDGLQAEGQRCTGMRWSSHQGTKGVQPFVWLGTSRMLRSLLIYTDGLSEMDGIVSFPEHETLQNVMNHSKERADGDDATVMTLSWQVTE
ncbi:protein phosphatase 2C domain-containing protein [Paenibacillus turpanensis]|uniref:protein phosphatase 2C domain-containing protein n=1 Tax=Paenibacillus turpanensis TaxID=2689078 RepID=UPI00140C85AF|nr:protein phosphatase 2C domain-containing protein [Paenibacillus turpanensis]